MSKLYLIAGFCNLHNDKEQKSLLMNAKDESEKVGLKLKIQKMKIMASGPITSWQIDSLMEIVRDFLSLCYLPIVYGKK